MPFAAYFEPKEAEALEALLPVALAIPAAILAAGFSRRNSYLQALRDVWRRLIPAVQGAIQYTHFSAPSQSDFAETQKALSTAIDELRGVFKKCAAARGSGRLISVRKPQGHRKGYFVVGIRMCSSASSTASSARSPRPTPSARAKVPLGGPWKAPTSSPAGECRYCRRTATRFREPGPSWRSFSAS